MQIPNKVQSILQRFDQNGFDSYVVGGCVRDFLLGLTPHDWDICTAATPETVMKLFDDCQVVPTGIKHGTVTVVIEDEPFEITTFRTENGYEDHRHPQQVSFTTSIEEDLSRRDFTMNAVAYHPNRGFVDPFGGQADAQKRVLRCVGMPQLRFEEDALRILRALRFASVYDLNIDAATGKALLEKRATLSMVANERVQSELKRLLTGQAVSKIFETYYPILFEIIPELKVADGLDQHTPYHCYDVLRHIFKTVEHAPQDCALRLAALLHDIGKPACFSMDESGTGHFYGHAKIGVKMAQDILTRLRFDTKIIEQVCLLIKYHDTPIEPNDATVLRWMNRLGVDGLTQLIALKRADCLAHNFDFMQPRMEELENICICMDRLLAQQSCFSLRDLAVNGNDITQLGIPAGKAVGDALRYLLDEVIEQRLPNEKSALLDDLRKSLDYFIKTR